MRLFVIYVKFLSCCKFLTLFHDLKHKSNLTHPLRKTVRIRSYSGPHFSRIFPHSDWIRRVLRIRSYSGPYFSHSFPHSDWIRRVTSYLSVFSPNAGKCGKNADQNNSEYGYFLRSDQFAAIFIVYIVCSEFQEVSSCWSNMSRFGSFGVPLFRGKHIVISPGSS